MRPLIERIARRAADAQDAQLDAVPLHTLRARVASEASVARSRPPKAWLWAAALAACGLLVSVRGLLITGVARVGDAPLPHAQAAELGYVAAPPEGPLLLTFAGGSRVRLGAGSAVRIAQLDPRGAHVHVERGEVRFDVERRPGGHWRVEAGPFTTEVVGTCFDVRWEPDGRGFELVMHEGTVGLSGPGVVPGRRVSGTERVAVGAELLRAANSASNTPSVTPLRKAVDLALPRVAQGALAEGKGARKQPALEQPPAAAPAFDTLARAGRYAEAVASAQAAGWDGAVATSPAAVLLRLADAARLAHRDDLARPAYLALRARFPGTADAARAAFALGRLSDAGASAAGRASREEATAWFTRYLAEAPSGALRPEAMGRLLEIALMRGASADARVWAERLLALQPDGPSAVLARRVLDGAR